MKIRAAKTTRGRLSARERQPLPTVVPPRRTRRVAKAVEDALATRPRDRYVLRLYVAGATARSQQALLHIRRLCETKLDGDYDLEVIDIYQQPIIAREGQIVATPTLVREFPPPMRRLIGNLANTTGLFVGLDLHTKGRTRR